MLFPASVQRTAVPRHRTASSSPGPGPLSILSGWEESRPPQAASGPEVWVPSQSAGESPEVRTPVRRWGTEAGKKAGEDQKLWPQVPLKPGAPSPPLVQRSGCGRLCPKSRGLYGTVPSRPPRGPAGWGGGTGPTPPTPPAAAAAADRAPIGPECE